MRKYHAWQSTRAEPQPSAPRGFGRRADRAQCAMSPAAKIPGTFVSKNSLTNTPLSVAMPACSARHVFGRTPIPTTTKSQSNFVPSSSCTYRSDSRRRSTEMKFHTMRFVRFANQMSHFGSQNFRERHRISSDDRDFQFALAQRPRHFQSDEARADHDRAPVVPSITRRSVFEIKTCGKSAPKS